MIKEERVKSVFPSFFNRNISVFRTFLTDPLNPSCLENVIQRISDLLKHYIVVMEIVHSTFC